MTTFNGTGRLRWRVKETLAGLIRTVNARYRSTRRAGVSYRPLVLGYHRVVEDFEAASRTEMASMLTSTRDVRAASRLDRPSLPLRRSR